MLSAHKLLHWFSVLLCDDLIVLCLIVSNAMMSPTHFQILTCFLLNNNLNEAYRTIGFIYENSL